jgi:uncharacterized protein
MPARKIFFRLETFLALALIGLAAGCHKKPDRAAEIRTITQEMVVAAQRATGRRPDIAIRPQMSPAEPGERSVLLYDEIEITLSDAVQVVPVVKELEGVASRYGLARMSTPAATSTQWAYGLDGRTTQVIHILPPAAAPSVNPAAAPPEPPGPKLAIIIDDMGNDQAAAQNLFSLPFRLTVSVLPYHEFSEEIAKEAHQRGDQVLLHLPMQAQGPNGQPEAIELHPGMNEQEVSKTLAGMLAAVPYANGVNNHQGSLATSDAALMAELMPLLRERHLFFIDSRTAATTVAYDTAQRDGVRSAYRKVFLDDTVTREAVLQQLSLAEKDARKDGWAIAIGHPHPETLDALREEVPKMRQRGIRLVFASDLTH